MQQAVYFAQYEEDGKLAGLYNSVRHRNIPSNTIRITASQHSLISKYPEDFAVDTKTRELKRVKNSAALEDLGAALERTRFEYEAMVAAGVEHDGVYYCADDAASATITQCLAISAYDDKHPFMIPAVSGGVKMVEVDLDTLVAVAKLVNSLRAKAKAHLLDINAQTSALLQGS